jgi:hypothetical protein
MSWLDRWRQNVVLEARQKYESVRQVITYCQKIGVGRASSPDSEPKAESPSFSSVPRKNMTILDFWSCLAGLSYPFLSFYET